MGAFPVMIHPVAETERHLMKPPAMLESWVRTPRMTRGRVIAAFGVALVADGLQIVLGPFGLVGPVQAIDVIVMVLETWLVGFHWLLLPTFALEFIPVADVLPTWTGCVAIVIFRRRQQQAKEPPPIEVDGQVLVDRLPAKPPVPPQIRESRR